MDAASAASVTGALVSWRMNHCFVLPWSTARNGHTAMICEGQGPAVGLWGEHQWSQVSREQERRAVNAHAFEGAGALALEQPGSF